MKKIDRIPDTGQQWYKDAKYGLFIHWGLYAILAGEYKGQKTDHISEWIMNTLNIPVEEYEKLAGEFCSQQFCADELVRMANLRGGFHGNGGTEWYKDAVQELRRQAYYCVCLETEEEWPVFEPLRG